MTVLRASSQSPDGHRGIRELLNQAWFQTHEKANNEGLFRLRNRFLPPTLGILRVKATTYLLGILQEAFYGMPYAGRTC